MVTTSVLCDRPRATAQVPVAESPAFAHVPVLVGEVLEAFASLPEGIIVDATLGSGGHAAAIAASDGARMLVGIDRDPAALAAARERFDADRRLAGRLRTVRARFDVGLESLVGGEPVAGVLFDLGVSSPQFDRPERGFSYRNDGPLDMRMDPDSELTAAGLIADSPPERIARILRTYGDERYADRIARAIVASRPTTTTQLADVVTSAIPAPARRRGGHPAKRTFQALRIAVNDELSALEAALGTALDLVRPGGRIVAISYHSGEDRIVKSTFREASTGGCTCPPGLPCGCGAVPRVRLVQRGGITPRPDEVARNRRAASARMRTVEVLA